MVLGSQRNDAVQSMATQDGFGTLTCRKLGKPLQLTVLWISTHLATSVQNWRDISLNFIFVTTIGRQMKYGFATTIHGDQIQLLA